MTECSNFITRIMDMATDTINKTIASITNRFHLSLRGLLSIIIQNCHNITLMPPLKKVTPTIEALSI